MGVTRVKEYIGPIKIDIVNLTSGGALFKPAGHTIFQLTYNGKVIGYLDNGYLGGKDHIFFTIPSPWKPIGGPL